MNDVTSYMNNEQREMKEPLLKVLVEGPGDEDVDITELRVTKPD